jgi:hypothetical protein
VVSLVETAPDAVEPFPFEQMGNLLPGIDFGSFGSQLPAGTVRASFGTPFVTERRPAPLVSSIRFFSHGILGGGVDDCLPNRR